MSLDTSDYKKLCKIEEDLNEIEQMQKILEDW